MKDLYVKASVIYIGSDRYGLDWEITFKRLRPIIEDPDMDDLVTSEYSNIGSYEERSPMARLRHVSILHLVVAGDCLFETAGVREGGPQRV